MDTAEADSVQSVHGKNDEGSGESFDIWRGKSLSDLTIMTKEIKSALGIGLLFGALSVLADETAYWGAYAEAGEDHSGQVYGLAWNCSTALEALAAAESECCKRLPGNCAPSYWVFTTALGDNNLPYGSTGSGYDLRDYKNVAIFPKRCILVTESEYSTGGGDVVRMFLDSEREAREAYETRDPAELHIGNKLHDIVCNKR